VRRTLVGLALLAGACGGGSPAPTKPEVVVYVSHDRPFAEPILQVFERTSGIAVRAVYDTEETKSTGLANRLLAESAQPVADVFWANEPVRTITLADRGAIAPYQSPAAASIPTAFRDPKGLWTGFAARCRVIVINTDLVPEAERPLSVLDLEDRRWKGRVVMADPAFGTTSFHVAALDLVLGPERLDAWARALAANEVRLLGSNSAVREEVAEGRAAVGLTDTDDAYEAVRSGKPVAVVWADRDGIGVVLMPNLVSLVARAPHAESAKRLIDFLLSPEVEDRLAASDAVQLPLRAGRKAPIWGEPVERLKPMTVDYAVAARRLEGAVARVRGLLGR
jgi:iron(III) transport system substrate-binding protein